MVAVHSVSKKHLDFLSVYFEINKIINSRYFWTFILLTVANWTSEWLFALIANHCFLFLLVLNQYLIYNAGVS